jgi:hypothetical protein
MSSWEIVSFSRRTPLHGVLLEPQLRKYGSIRALCKIGSEFD